MSKWQRLVCAKCENFIAWSNGKSLIHGGTLFQVKSVKILCRSCHKVGTYHLETTKNHVSFLTDREISSITQK